MSKHHQIRASLIFFLKSVMKQNKQKKNKQKTNGETSVQAQGTSSKYAYLLKTSYGILRILNVDWLM